MPTHITEAASLGLHMKEEANSPAPTTWVGKLRPGQGKSQAKQHSNADIDGLWYNRVDLALRELGSFFLFNLPLRVKSVVTTDMD